jgi:AcrR family transcriptional regulator
MAKRSIGHEKHKSRILAEATRLFTERGYEAVSLREIARGAGVHLPTIYWLYTDKRDLFEACCRTAMQVSLNELEGLGKDIDEPHDTLLAMVGALCASHIGGSTKIVHRLLLDNDIEMLQQIAPSLTGSKAFKRMLKAIAIIDPDGNSKLTAFTLFALVAGFIEHLKLIRLAKMGGVALRTPDEIARHLLRTVFSNVDWDKRRTPLNGSADDDDEAIELPPPRPQRRSGVRAARPTEGG